MTFDQCTQIGCKAHPKKGKIETKIFYHFSDSEIERRRRIDYLDRIEIHIWQKRCSKKK